MRRPEFQRDDVLVFGGTTGIAAAAVFGAAHSGETGPILAFVGALLVAVITAREARGRQAKQLSHDRELRALEMDHERHLRDAEHIRAFLDEAAEAFETYVDSLDNFHAFGPEAVSRDDAEKWLELQLTLFAASREAAVVSRRMDLRIALDHPVRRAFWAAIEGLHRARDALTSEDPPWGPQALQRFDIEKAGAMGDLALFTSSAEAYIGARFEESDMTALARAVVEESHG